MSLEDRGMNLRSILTFIIIVFTTSALLAMVGAGSLSLLVSVLGFAGLSTLFIFRYFKSMRGYQDRYTKSGKRVVNQAQMIRLILLALLFFSTFSFLSQLIGDTPIAFAITALSFGLIVQFIDQRSSRDMIEYVALKEKNHQDFVDSISDPKDISGKCMSCNKKMDAAEKFCPHCGFEQREINKESGYLG
jgi:hypothetical protein